MSPVENKDRDNEARPAGGDPFNPVPAPVAKPQDGEPARVAAAGLQSVINEHRAVLQEAVELLSDTNENSALNSPAKRRELAEKLKVIIGPNKG